MYPELTDGAAIDEDESERVESTGFYWMKACRGVGVFFTIPLFGLNLVLFDYDDELQRNSFICLGKLTLTGTQSEGEGRRQALFFLIDFSFLLWRAQRLRTVAQRTKRLGLNHLASELSSFQVFFLQAGFVHG